MNLYFVVLTRYFIIAFRSDFENNGWGGRSLRSQQRFGRRGQEKTASKNPNRRQGKRHQPAGRTSPLSPIWSPSFQKIFQSLQIVKIIRIKLQRTAVSKSIVSLWISLLPGWLSDAIIIHVHQIIHSPFPFCTALSSVSIILKSPFPCTGM